MTDRLPQYNLRSLFGLMTVCCIVVVACRLAAQYAPQLIFVAIAISLVCAGLSVWLFGLATMFTLALILAPDDLNRKENLNRCGRLALFAVLGLSPFGALLLVQLLIR